MRTEHALECTDDASMRRMDGDGRAAEFGTCPRFQQANEDSHSFELQHTRGVVVTIHADINYYMACGPSDGGAYECVTTSVHSSDKCGIQAARKTSLQSCQTEALAVHCYRSATLGNAAGGPY